MNKLSDELTRVLAEAGEGLKALQEDVITTGFDPDDPVSVDAAIRHVVDGIVGTVRPSDFVGIGGATSIVIGFPGLAATDIGPVEDRIRKIIRERIAAPLELAIDVAEGDAIDKLLQQG